MTNYYQLLGLNHAATSEQIKRAYLEFASHFEPARHANSPFFTERFKEVLTAYEVLIDPVRRQEYDIEYHANIISEASAGRARALRSNNFLFFLLGASLMAAAAYGWLKWEKRQQGTTTAVVSEQVLEAQSRRAQALLRVNNLLNKQQWPLAVTVADSALNRLKGDTLPEAGDVPATAQLFFMRALAKSDMQNDTGAVHDFTRAIDGGYIGGAAFNNRAALKQKLGDAAGAEQDYFMAVMFSPKEASYRMNLGALEYEQDNYRQAEAQFVEATRINPQLGEAWYMLGNVQYQMKKSTDACKAWQKAGEQGIEPAFDNLNQFCK